MGDATPRTDAQIQQDVIAELVWEPASATPEIGVAVAGGVVTLSGTVESDARKAIVVAAAQRVTGVKAIAEELRVLPPGGINRTDTELAHAVATALDWERLVPQNCVIARIDEGWVLLTGDVALPEQRDAAERAVRFLKGVRGVTNEIHVSPRAAAGRQATATPAAPRR